MFMQGTPQQEVAYAATLLRDNAHDWFMAYLRRNQGRYPRDWATMAAALVERFGSRLREKQALANIMVLRQNRRSVRDYAAEFENCVGRLTCLVLMTRAHTYPTAVPSPRQVAVPFYACDAHSRLLSAPWVGHRAASRCRRLQVGLLLSRSAQDRWLPDEVRACRDGSSFRRVLGAQPMLLQKCTNGGKQIHTNAEKNNEEGTSTLLSSPMFAHRGTSACCAPTTQHPVNVTESHDLGKIPDRFTT